MRTRVQNQEILRKALEAFERTTRLVVEFYPVLEPVLETGIPDGAIDIKLNDMYLHFNVEIKETLTNAMIGPVVQELRKNKGKSIIITRYVTPQIAVKLKEINIPFIDTAGNIYIREPNLFLFIKGNRPVEIPNKNLQTRAFRPTGLQVIYTLLCNPKLEDANYREIARVADVALGTVGWVMQDLKRMGFVVDMGRRGRRLIKKDNLLTKWVTAYPEQLRPKKLIGKYDAMDPEFWKYKDLPLDKAYWGGEVAAAKLNKYLKPEVVTIYTNDKVVLNKYMIENRIRNDPEGEVEILKTFWEKGQKKPYQNLVHPVLIYADLQATGDARNIETAEMIYEQELAGFIRED
jgi:hypothetical protein